MKNTETEVTGNIIDIPNRNIFPGKVIIRDGKIFDIVRDDSLSVSTFIMPGFIDAHVHIESSMLIPARFAQIAVKQGTVSVVSDPHEIANVLGAEGINWMISNGREAPLKFYFGASSCVPATEFETSGAKITSSQVADLLKKEDVYGLGEMMNFPGVINGDPEVKAKITASKNNDKPIDGHAPGLSGEDLITYANAGISSDHESATREEALEKLKLGIKLIIREGSAAKNFDRLVALLDEYPDDIMFCTDDSHPKELENGHINSLVKRAIERGLDFYNVLKVATINPVRHYNLNVGLLQKGDAADFVVLDNIENFNVLETYIDGRTVYSSGKVHFDIKPPEIINNFVTDYIGIEQLKVVDKQKQIRVIEAFNNELFTKQTIYSPLKDQNNEIISDTANDILKLVVVNRYRKVPPQVAFIKGFGFKEGAIASSVAHDSHNIIAVGVTDTDIVNAVNGVIQNSGGIIAVNGTEMTSLPLELAGLMSTKDGATVSGLYKNVNTAAKKLGTELSAPFMTLSFMGLLVIPELKLSDKGLFDVSAFKFTDLFV